MGDGKQGSAVWLIYVWGGLTRIDADGGQTAFSTRKQRNGLPADAVLSLAVDAQGVLWVGTTKGLARLQGEIFETVELPAAEGRR